MRRRELLLGAAAAGIMHAAPKTSRHRGTSPLAHLPHNDTIVFFSPHQDDETISMGMAVATACAAGKRVYIVEVTDGGATGATPGVNRSIAAYNATHPHAHVAELDNTHVSIARSAEQVAAARALGVPASHVLHESIPGATPRHGHPYIVVGDPNYKDFLEVVNTYVSQFRGAAFCTMSWLDMIGDHYFLGYALDSVARTRKLANVRFFQSPLYQKLATDGPTVSFDLPWHNPGTKTLIPRVPTPAGAYLTNTAVRNRISLAVDAYRKWDPEHGRFGIGWSSVHAQLTYAQMVTRSWMHLDSRHWLTAAAQHEASLWIKTYQNPRFAPAPVRYAGTQIPNNAAIPSTSRRPQDD